MTDGLSDPTLADRSARLTREALRRMAPAPFRRPRDAATLILIDRAGGEPRILLGRRHPGHVFMPGMFVFPGGAVDAGDRQMAAHGALGDDCARRLAARVTRPSAARVRALALAAIRETFEETGLMIGTPGTATAPNPAWAPFAARGLRPNLSALRFVARAITPPGRPRRFDTRFFSADAAAVVDRVEGIVGPDAELIELAWVPLADAGALPVPMITRVIIEELADQLAADQPGTTATRRPPVPLYAMRYKVFRRAELA